MKTTVVAATTLAVSVLHVSAAPQIDHLIVEGTLREEMAAASAPGGAFAIVRDGRVVARGLGVAVRGGREAVTADTRFMVGSVTKTLTSAAVLLAHQGGAPRADAPVGQVLTGLDPAIARLTPRHLISQTSGLGDMPGAMGTTRESALAEFARSLGPRQLVTPMPGGFFSYSNPGFALAGAALEAARKEPFADAMRSLLFSPLGMKRTTVRHEEVMKEPHARGHGPGGEPLPEADVDTRLSPAGYAWSTAGDLAVFAREWLAAHAGAGRVLTQPMADTMATKIADFPPTPDGTGYGHGLFLESRRDQLVLQHGGMNTGFSARLVLVPARRLGVVLLMNGEGASFTRSVNAALGLHDIGSVVTAPLPQGRVVNEEAARAMVGRYVNRWPLELVWESGALRARWQNEVRELRRFEPDRYVGHSETGPPLELRVVRDPDRRVVLVRQFLWVLGKDYVAPGGAAGR